MNDMKKEYTKEQLSEIKSFFNRLHTMLDEPSQHVLEYKRQLKRN